MVLVKECSRWRARVMAALRWDSRTETCAWRKRRERRIWAASRSVMVAEVGDRDGELGVEGGDLRSGRREGGSS